MAADNATIAAIFDEIADLLEIQSANPFRVRAYRNAARTVGDLGTELRAILAGGMPLTDIPGIGEDLALKIQEILDTGGCEFLQRLEQEVPPGVVGLMKVPGLGPKRVKSLWRDLDVRSLEQLQAAALSQRVRALPGFGEKTEARILEALQRMRGEPRMKLAAAARHAEALTAHLRPAPGVEHAEIAGSCRRMRETVGDLDIVVVASAHAPVMDRLAHYAEVAQVDASGTTRATVRLKCGLQVDVRVVPQESFGAAMVYFTGSKAHNIAIRRLALDHGLKINEYGVFRDEQRIAGETEASVYSAVGLPWIAPELREDRGEIEAAARGELPSLVEPADLQGDLHIGSMRGEGRESIAQLARAAQARGLSYLVIADAVHAPPRGGLDEAGLAKQGREIDRINSRLSACVVLKGAEVEILEDGRLDLPDAVLETLEVVTVAVRRRFDLPRAKQTARLLRALANPHVHVLAQPWTQDLVEGRDTWDVDMQKVLREAGQRGVALELNAHPDRVALSDAHCRMAAEEGVRVALSSGARSRQELHLLRFAVGRARRGWLAREHVLDAGPLASLRQWLRERARS